MKKILFLAVLIPAAFYFFPSGKAVERTVFSAKLKDLSGKEQSISQWRGKVLVVNFWATWCPPCREEMPGFVRLMEKYKDKDMMIVGVSLDDIAKVREFSREIGVNYPILNSPSGDIEGLDLKGLPYTLVFDKQGKIVESHMGAISQDSLEKKIAQLL